MNTNKKNSVVRAVVPKELKDEALEILDEMGISQSAVIQDLFKYIVMYRTIPFQREEIITLKQR